MWELVLRLYPMDTEDEGTIVPTDVTIVPTDVAIVPNDVTIVPTGLTIVPNGVTIVPTGVGCHFSASAAASASPALMGYPFVTLYK